MISARSTFLFIYKVIFEIKRENKRTNMADKTEKAVDLGILEEDDEFEEFPAEDWKETNESELKNDAVWECNWEDEDTFDDFNQQLRLILLFLFNF